MSKLESIEKRVTTIDNRRGAAVVQRIVGRRLQRIRDRILLRDEYTCQLCGLATIDLEVDHIVPLHLGGAESDENRQCLCRRCHGFKTDREERERKGEDADAFKAV